uniref:Uncharacterized protein n=1 Tax=Meloidogyne incognita TaxID=6306 RepID=A0A914MHX6_MELIC
MNLQSIGMGLKHFGKVQSTNKELFCQDSSTDLISYRQFIEERHRSCNSNAYQLINKNTFICPF